MEKKKDISMETFLYGKKKKKYEIDEAEFLLFSNMI